MSSDVWRTGSQSTIPELLMQRLESDPDSQYLDVCGDSVSAAAVYDVCARLATSLCSMGINPGDRVATLIENSIEAVYAWWGIILSGGIAVPINTAYKGEYLRHQLADSGSRVIIVAAEFLGRLEAVAPSVKSLQHVVAIGETRPKIKNTSTALWTDLLQSDATPPQLNTKPSDLGTFIYTGGTTGLSKGCMLSHNYHEALTRQIGICWERTSDDVVWTPLPLFHFNAITTAVMGPLVFRTSGLR
jgi:carnitine-CoA ligase